VTTYEPPTHAIHSPAWIAFTQLSFAVALVALGAGIALLDVEIAARGYLAMGALLVVVTSITMSKTIRDQHEAGRVTNRVEEAKLTNFLASHDPIAS